MKSGNWFATAILIAAISFTFTEAKAEMPVGKFDCFIFAIGMKTPMYLYVSPSDGMLLADVSEDRLQADVKNHQGYILAHITEINTTWVGRNSSADSNGVYLEWFYDDLSKLLIVTNETRNIVLQCKK